MSEQHLPPRPTVPDRVEQPEVIPPGELAMPAPRRRAPSRRVGRVAGQGHADRLDGQAAARRGARRTARRAPAGSGWRDLRARRSTSWPRPCRPTCRTSCARLALPFEPGTVPTRGRAAGRPGPARRLARGPVPRHPGHAVRPADGRPPAARADAGPAHAGPGAGAAADAGPGPGAPGHLPLRATGRVPTARWYPRKAHRCNSLGPAPSWTRPPRAAIPTDSTCGPPRQRGSRPRGGLVHPPPRPHRVLDARRRGPGRRASWPRRRPTGSRRSASPTTATCTGSSTSTRRARRQGIKPIIGTEAYMAHEQPLRAPGPPGPGRRHRRRRRGRQEALLPPHRCWPRTTPATAT